MSLLQDIYAYRPAKMPCSFISVMQQLDEQDRADLVTALADTNVMTSAILNALKGRGFDVSKNTMARHRRGECACP